MLARSIEVRVDAAADVDLPTGDTRLLAVALVGAAATHAGKVVLAIKET